MTVRQRFGESSASLPTIAAVVVHHRNYSSVGSVVKALLEQGILAQNLIVVDNSEEPLRQSELREQISVGVDLVFTRNHGYAAAVNYALDYFAKRPRTPEFFLVSTHEARPFEGAIWALQGALSAQPSAAVAGPTLVSGESKEFVWSTGGYLHSVTGIPAHYDHRASTDVLDDVDDPVLREWLDGAFLLYRWEDIRRHRVPEHYFLYMEETDLHLTLRKEGRHVLWVPAARVWQDSNGIPPYYFARNIRLLLKEHGGVLRWVIVPPLAVMRKLAADLLRARTVKNVKGYCKGLLVRLPRMDRVRDASAIQVHLINPLGAALKHYESELTSVLRAAGASVTTQRFAEPSASGQKPFRWVLSYLNALISARLSGNTKRANILVLWPVLGYLDLLIFGLLGLRRISIVLHDPNPLVRSVGYSKFSKGLASALGANTELIAHSQKALEVIRDDISTCTTAVLPHPMVEPKPQVAPHDGRRPVVRVLGQYKADRDLPALLELGRELSKSADLEVHGRGWPAIEGWKVFEGFVTEERLDELMTESAAVLIPYKRFFQSGIAVRALEMGTPFVGPKESVLAEMLGAASPLLVEEKSKSEWPRAVHHAIQHGTEEARQAGLRWRAMNVISWSSWVRDACGR